MTYCNSTFVFNFKIDITWMVKYTLCGIYPKLWSRSQPHVGSQFSLFAQYSKSSSCAVMSSTQWHHNEHPGVSNHRRLVCLFSGLFRLTSKKTSKPALLALCEGIHRSPVDSPHKGQVTRKPIPFDDVIMSSKKTRIMTFVAGSDMNNFLDIKDIDTWTKWWICRKRHLRKHVPLNGNYGISLIQISLKFVIKRLVPCKQHWFR